MSSQPTSNDYNSAIYQLTNDNSELILEKKKFEQLFQQFLDRYRPYSSVGTSLSEPIFDIKEVTISNLSK